MYLVGTRGEKYHRPGLQAEFDYLWWKQCEVMQSYQRRCVSPMVAGTKCHLDQPFGRSDGAVIETVDEALAIRARHMRKHKTMKLEMERIYDGILAVQRNEPFAL